MFDFTRKPEAAPGEISEEALQKLFAGSGELCTRRVALPGGGGTVTVCWLDGCADGRALARDVLEPLRRLRGCPGADVFRRALNGGVWASPAQERRELRALGEDLTLGRCAVLFPGQARALSVEIKAAVGRSVETPTVEKSVLGAREAFTETLRTNTALLRRRFPGPALKLRELSLGRLAGTKAVLVYIEGVAEETRLDAVWRALEGFAPQAVTSTGALERALCAPGRGSFPRVVHTERPDRLLRGLLRGQVGVLCDGQSVALLLPATLPELLSVEEDHSRHAAVATALLWLRWTALLLALLLPAVYTAAVIYHPEMIPHALLQSMIRARADVPFSTAVEVLGMLFSFELIQEAGIRLPEPVGQTVSLIGALIVGESAVEARLLSPMVIIIVAMAGIGGYALPSQELSAAVRLWRLALVVCAALLGLFGVILALVLLVWRLCGAETLGLCWLWPLCDGEGSFGVKSLWRRPNRGEAEP